MSGRRTEGRGAGCAGPLGHPPGSPGHVGGRDRVDVLHDGLDPIPPDSRRHSREGEGALLCLHRRRGVSSDWHLPTPEEGPAGRLAARWPSQECGMCLTQDEQSWRAKERAKPRTLSWLWLTRASPPRGTQQAFTFTDTPCSLRSSQTGRKENVRAGSSGKGPGHGRAREGGRVDGEGVHDPGGGSGPGACNHAQQAHRVTGDRSGRHEAQWWLGPDGGCVCWAEEGHGDLLGGWAGCSGDERGFREAEEVACTAQH